MNKGGRVAAKLNISRGDAEAEVCRHVIWRIIGVLVRYLTGYDIDRAKFIRCKIHDGIQRETSWAARDSCKMSSACGAGNRKPGARDIHRFTKIDNNVG
jgi:hypothetical protein